MKKTIIVSIAVFSGIISGILLIVAIFYYSEIVSETRCLGQKNASSCLASALTKMIEGDYADSYKYVGAGCVLGDAELCNISGVILNAGLNGYFDSLFSYAIFDYACDLGDQKSCSDREFLTIEAPSSNNKTFLEIKAAFMLGNEEKTEKLIIEKTSEKPQLVIMILKDPALKKSAENKHLHEHYLSLLRALKQKNKSYLIRAGGIK